MKRLNRDALLVVGGVLVVGLVLGMALGAVSGLLLAPQSGEETRHQLRKQANEYGESMVDKSQGIIDAGKRQVSKVLQRGSEVVELARSS